MRPKRRLSALCGSILLRTTVLHFYLWLSDDHGFPVLVSSAQFCLLQPAKTSRKSMVLFTTGSYSTLLHKDRTWELASKLRTSSFLTLWLSLISMFQNCAALRCSLWLFRSCGKSFLPVPAGTRSKTRPRRLRAGF